MALAFSAPVAARSAQCEGLNARAEARLESVDRAVRKGETLRERTLSRVAAAKGIYQTVLRPLEEVPVADASATRRGEATVDRAWAPVLRARREEARLASRVVSEIAAYCAIKDQGALAGCDIDDGPQCPGPLGPAQIAMEMDVVAPLDWRALRAWWR